VLLEGYQENPDSEEIVLALQKFERENKHYKDALRILTESVDKIESEKVHMQTVQLHREIGDLPRALTLVNEALAKYRSFYKLWLIKA
jgi:pre-mRNA-processing factor 6